MFVAKSIDFDHIFVGSEIQPQLRESINNTFSQGFVCPICGRNVTFNTSIVDSPFDYFTHSDDSPDCFSTEAMSDDHRLAVEVTVKVLYNRLSEISQEPVEISVEKWIGTRSKFVIADVRVTSPYRIAAEVYYKADRLGLGRRLGTMFSNDYQTYLIFHTGGRHDVDRIERYLKRVSPLQVGHFNPDNLELSLGDLFSEHRIELNSDNSEVLPDYVL